MMKKTHLFTGVAVTLRFITLDNVLLLPIAVAGSIAPDWDYILGIKHRTITHTLLALVISSATLSIFDLKLGLLWGLNYSTHLLLDSFTKMGVPLLSPFKNKYYGAKLFKTRGGEDGLIALVALSVILSILGD